jgi:hypothetical protein
MKKFRVKFKPIQEGFFSIFILTISVGFLITGASITHWGLAFRKGDSVIPKERDLTISGPYLISKRKYRITPFIIFSDSNGRLKYKENLYETSVSSKIIDDLIKIYPNQAVAYLSVDDENPIRKIWEIKIKDTTVLTYRDAVSYYHSENSAGNFRILVGAIGLILFVISLIDIKRVNDAS